MTSENKTKVVSKKNKVKALTYARSLLVEGRKSTICGALKTVRREEPQLAEAVWYLHAYINEALSGCTFLHGWQRNVGIAPGYVHTEKGRKDRIAWVDWMIQCYKDDA